NADNPDSATAAFAGDVTYVLTPGGVPGCQNGNMFVPTTFSADFQALPPCPSTPIPGCPFVPGASTSTTSTTSVTSTSMTIPSTTTSTSSTTSTTLATPTFTDIYNNIMIPAGCTGCHPNVFQPLDLSTKAIAYSSLVNVASVELPTMDRVEPNDPDN